MRRPGSPRWPVTAAPGCGAIWAGLTVAAYLVPQVMAYSVVAGLPPVTGLWAILPSFALYAVLGTSPLQSVGPETTAALMTATVVAPLAGSDPSRYATLATALGATVGLLCLAARVLRLGFLAHLLSRPVLIGYSVVGDAENVEHALVRAPAVRPHVAVLDVRLPDGNGISVCRALRSRMPELAVPMLTSFDDEDALLDAIMAGPRAMC